MGLKNSARRFKDKIDAWGNHYFACSAVSFGQMKSLFFPALMDQSFLVLLNVLNTAMVSSSGAQAVSAVSIVDSLNNLFMNVFIGVATGGTVVVAQCLGKGEKQRVPQAVCQTISLSAVAATGIAVLLIVFRHAVLFAFFGRAEQGILDQALLYMVGTCCSYPLFAVLQSIIGTLRGMGDTKSSMFITIFLNGIYVAFNFLFINVFSMGIMGVVVSILLARFISVFISFYILFHKREGFRFQMSLFTRVDFSVIRSVLLIGVPTAMEQIFVNCGNLITQTFVVSMGTAQITANAIGRSLMALMCLPGNSINLCAVTIVGQCVGAGVFDEARSILRRIMKFARWLQFAFCVVLAAVMPFIVMLYHPSPEVFRISMIVLGMHLFFQQFSWPEAFAAPTGLRAAGDAAYTSIAALCSMWMVRVVLGYLLAVLFHWGVYGVWAAMCVEWNVRGYLFTRRLKGDKWYRHRIV